jgi:hypothetical protein
MYRVCVCVCGAEARLGALRGGGRLEHLLVRAGAAAAAPPHALTHLLLLLLLLHRV